MRCFICDVTMERVQYDSRDGKVCPCTACQSVITDTVQDYDRQHRDDEFVFALVEPLDEYLEDEDEMVQ